MKKILFIASAAFLFSCGNAEPKSDEVTEVVEEVTVEMSMHGVEITEEGAISTTEFLAQFDGKEALETKISGKIEEVCSKKGCWMVMNLSDDKDMRITFKDYEFFVPLEAAGKETIIQGTATMDTTTVEMLKHYAEDAGDSQEEIDAITEPEFNYAFEAVGVIITEEITTSNAH
tara:strand:+ start:245 stop:766 length:522 start_codon:yes stop_codon:yes gene_type:complete